MDDKQFNELTNKLNQLTKIMAYNIIQGKTLKEQVVTLHSLGFSITDIAHILNKRVTDLGKYIYGKKRKK